MEYTFTVTVYDLEDASQVRKLREAIQDRILEEVEMRGLYMGPVVSAEVPAEVVDGEKVVD